MTTHEQPWKGYTLSEIRLHRIVNLTKMELEKSRIAHITEKYTSKSGSVSSMPILNKLVGALDFVDYGIVAWRIGKSVLSLFRRKRR